jgi:hypothetical protein
MSERSQALFETDHREWQSDPGIARMGARVALRVRREGWVAAGMAAAGPATFDQPISGARQADAESSKVILALPERSRALVKRVPEPVQIELKKLSSRGAM